MVVALLDDPLLVGRGCLVVVGAVAGGQRHGSAIAGIGDLGRNSVRQRLRRAGTTAYTQALSTLSELVYGGSGGRPGQSGENQEESCSGVHHEDNLV